MKKKVKTKKVKKVVKVAKKKLKVKKVKTKVVEKPIVKQEKEFDYIPLGKCCSCKKSVRDTDFGNDVEAYKAFAQGGLCKKCQMDITLEDE